MITLRFMPPVVVGDAEAVRQLAGKPLRRSLVLDCPELTSEECNAWQERIKALATDCGCSWGAAFLGGAVVTYLALLLVPDFRQAWNIWLHLAMGIGGPILSAGAGKALGLVRASCRLKHTWQQLALLLDERSAGKREDQHADLSQVG